jgi:hypothetical protein
VRIGYAIMELFTPKDVNLILADLNSDTDSIAKKMRSGKHGGYR